MGNYFEIINLVVLAFIAATTIEAVIAFATKKGSRSVRETLSNFFIYAVGKGWRDYVMRGLELAFLGLVYSMAPYKIPMTAATLWWAIPLTIFVADFVYYWKHRTEHSVRVLWAYHSVHHSSEEFNLSTAMRLPWFGSFLSLGFYIPMALAGFHPLLILLGRSLVLLYQFWIHTESVGKLGWFDRVFNSPSNHRVHHGSNELYLDRNHGGILIIWDRLFGTYQAEEQTVIYGLTHKINTHSPLRINLVEPLAIWHDVKGASNWGDRFGYVFGRPGWQPAPVIVTQKVVVPYKPTAVL